MNILNWGPAQGHDAQFIGQCLRDDESTRLANFTGQRAQLAFIGVHNGALGSAVIRVAGTPVGMLCANPCPDLGLRAVYLGLTPHAEQVHEFDRVMLDAVRQHVQGDALGLVGSTAAGDKVQARWFKAMGFKAVPLEWAGCQIPLFYTVKPGAEALVQGYVAGLNPATAVRAAVH